MCVVVENWIQIDCHASASNISGRAGAGASKLRGCANETARACVCVSVNHVTFTTTPPHGHLSAKIGVRGVFRCTLPRWTDFA